MMKNKLSMTGKNILSGVVMLVPALCLLTGCRIPEVNERVENRAVPVSYDGVGQDTNAADLDWAGYFNDTNLVSLIETALDNNQELNIVAQEIEIARNEVGAREGEYLPFIGLRGGAGMDKVSRYSRSGALESNVEVLPGKEFPEPLQDYTVGAYATWELDIWKKLRNAKKAAVFEYLASIEGRHFMQTSLIAEIARTYYELVALDRQLDIVRMNIDIQSNALEVVRLQKQATRVTELAVKRFESEVMNTKGIEYEILQQIVETENYLNFIAGRYPQPVTRTSRYFEDALPPVIESGVPSDLLVNRPDIRQAEMELEASRLDIKVARARFLPSVAITSQVGLSGFKPEYLLQTPESLAYSVAGDFMAPLINRKAIKAAYFSASARQIQAVYHYEQTVLNAYIEVLNQLSLIRNLENKYRLKQLQVSALVESIDISNSLFRSARADYMEVLMTQRDALEQRFELVETRKRQLVALVDIYRSLGGGWTPTPSPEIDISTAR